MKSAIEHFDIGEVFDSASLVLQRKRLGHVLQVGEGERKLSALIQFLQLLDEVAASLAKHDFILTFVSWDWGHTAEKLGEAREGLVTSTTAASARLLNIFEGLLREDSLPAGEDMVHRVHARELLCLDVLHHALILLDSESTADSHDCATCEELAESGRCGLVVDDLALNSRTLLSLELATHTAVAGSVARRLHCVVWAHSADDHAADSHHD